LRHSVVYQKLGLPDYENFIVEDNEIGGLRAQDSVNW